MSCSYADGLSQYENKGVLGLEEVKTVYSPSPVWRESAIRDDFQSFAHPMCENLTIAFFLFPSLSFLFFIEIRQR